MRKEEKNENETHWEAMSPEQQAVVDADSEIYLELCDAQWNATRKPPIQCLRGTAIAL